MKFKTMMLKTKYISLHQNECLHREKYQLTYITSMAVCIIFSSLNEV